MVPGILQEGRFSAGVNELEESYFSDMSLQVAEAGSVRVTKLMEVERYSHVMHISSTVKGKLIQGLDAWDALRAALPAGTISGAPKVNSSVFNDAKA